MITLSRLVRIPALASFLILVPAIGWGLYIMAMIWWVCKYHEDIAGYLSDRRYRRSEMSDETREKFA